MNKVFLLIFSIAFAGCQSVSEKAETSDATFKGCHWISNGNENTIPDSLMYEEHPAPLFRKDFEVSGNIKKATLYITAAGYYKATVNSRRVGDVYLDPAWTDFSKRIYYSEYDLTHMLGKGTNCLGVILGNGFYNPLPLRMWGNRNLRDALSTGNPAFIAKLVLEYSNGNTEEVVTNNSWKFAPGPVVKNNVYLGITYDALNEIPDWDLPEFSEDSWQEATVVEGPGGKIQARFFPPIRVTRQIKPVKITSPEKNVFIADMGENFAGLYKIRLKGERGDTVHLRFGERIYEDGTLNPMTTVCGQIKRKGTGGPGAPDVAWQEDIFRLKDDFDGWLAPEFTFHTFRYIEIKGLTSPPDLSDIVGLALNTDVEQCNHFESSSALLNKIQDATLRTFKANLISVQSDCPAREKFGYGGDINAVSESYISNFDMQTFYRKAVYDWLDAMNDSVFVDTAPFVGIQYCGISWESAFLFLQYQLYLYYNDVDLVKELYPVNVKWMEKVHRLHPDGMVDSGLGDHESLQPVPVELTGTAHYLMAARVMKKFAEIMDDNVQVEKFSALETKLRELLLEKFWYNAEYDAGKMNKQTLFATLLYCNVIPNEEVAVATDSLWTAVKKGVNGHFTTGIFGTKYILEALSQNGLVDSVFSIVNSATYPGWGHMIDNGATTLWETWKESDNVYSNCHPMFGCVSEWFYRWLGGIRPDAKNPGFKQFILEPHIPQILDSVKCEYKTPSGYIRSGWKKNGETVVYNFTIPDGTQAHLKVPASAVNVPVLILNNQEVKINSDDFEKDYLKKELMPGNYILTTKLSNY